ncbi:MAG: cytochrome c peroxidase, partial [Pseudomonadota bacterium]
WVAWDFRPNPPRDWQASDLEVLRSLSLSSLPAIPDDPTNAVADDPLAAEFGYQLFFDPRLSANGAISCATCHQPARRFTDGLPKGQAIGQSARNTPSLIGTAYSPWQYWDGRKDSQWSQALSPLEDPNEHAFSRAAVVDVIINDSNYAAMYADLFGAMPGRADLDQIFANVGKVIAAYERLLMPGRARFDDYVDAMIDGESGDALSDDEVAGLQVFIGKADCLQCHNGPLMTNNEFHNTGVIALAGDLPDKGRVEGVRLVQSDPFNCQGRFTDAVVACTELEFARTGPELIGAFRTSSLRNLEGTQPYMHKGQLETLTDVIEHYDTAEDAMIGHNEAKPLNLSRTERRQLEAFLLTLAAPMDVDPKWLRPPSAVVPNHHQEQQAE